MKNVYAHPNIVLNITLVHHFVMEKLGKEFSVFTTHSFIRLQIKWSV